LRFPYSRQCTDYLQLRFLFLRSPAIMLHYTYVTRCCIIIPHCNSSYVINVSPHEHELDLRRAKFGTLLFRRVHASPFRNFRRSHHPSNSRSARYRRVAISQALHCVKLVSLIMSARAMRYLLAIRDADEGARATARTRGAPYPVLRGPLQRASRSSQCAANLFNLTNNKLIS
jgi:hypothetical protein